MTEIRKRAPGGGRKQLNKDDPADKTERHYVTMPASLWALARKLGGGKNASAGIRKALEKMRGK
jgi:hypothetical protein